MTTFKNSLFGALFLAVALAPASFAEVRTFTKEYSYRASDADSKITSRAIALDQAKKLLLEEIGVYVQSQFYDKSTSGGRTKDEVREEIITLTAGVVMTTVVDEKWDGKTYWLKAEIKADPEEVAKSVENLRRDNQKTNELKALRARLEESNRKVSKLREELSSGKPDDKKLEDYGKAVSELTAADWAHKADYLLSKRLYDAALEAADKASELDPNFELPHFIRGTAYLRLGKLKKAVECVEAALKVNPLSAPAYAARGYIFEEAGDHKRALKDLDMAIGLDPRYSISWLDRGYVYSHLGNAEAALENYTEAIRLDPGLVNAYVDRGMLLRMRGNYDEAMADLNEAIRLDPAYPNAHFHLGTVYLRLKDWGKALAEYDEAIRLDRAFADAYNNRGIALEKLGDNEKSVESFITAARLGATNSQSLLKSRGIRW